MHEVLVNRLGGLSLPRKSVVSLTDRPDMTLDVYRGRKTTIQPTKSSKHFKRLFQMHIPTYLDSGRARAYCACSGCDIFNLVYHFFFFPPFFWETARYRLKYCLKGPLSAKEPTNQPSDAYNLSEKNTVVNITVTIKFINPMKIIASYPHSVLSLYT